VDNIAVGGGTNAKLNEVHAAMALASLDSVEEQIAHHRRNFHEYKQRLASIAGIRLLGSDAGEQTGYRNVVVELLEGWPLTRDETVRVLDAEGILARPYYAPPLHRKPMAYPHFPAELPLTDALAERFLNLPSGALVDPEDVAQIVGILRFLAGSGSQVKDRLHQKGTA
jgi:dTDP-4-amino-4,6-dideoxygalactose transaminase